MPLVAKAEDADSVRTRFSWAAEVGSGIDMTGLDMSSIDFGVAAGVSRGWLRFAGVGLNANIMVGNSCRSYPVYALFRTDFIDGKQLLFLDARGGVSLNYLARNEKQTGVYGSVGVGINLATGRTFRSYIIVGYSYMGRGDVQEDEFTLTEYSPLHFAGLRLGVSF